MEKCQSRPVTTGREERIEGERTGQGPRAPLRLDSPHNVAISVPYSLQKRKRPRLARAKCGDPRGLCDYLAVMLEARGRRPAGLAYPMERT